jgi:hypothetical protein
MPKDNMYRADAVAPKQDSQTRTLSTLETIATSPAVCFRRGFLTAFSFVEVLIALAVVSIFLLALLKLHLISVKMTDVAEVTSKAVLLANEKIAENLAAGFPKQGTDSGSIEYSALKLNWRTEVTDLHLPPLDRAGIKGLRKVLVDVSWPYGVRLKHVQMLTYVADREINEK